MQERPIETRTLGEAMATDFVVEALPSDWVRITFVAEEDGELFERARIIMPRAVLEGLRRHPLPSSDAARPRKRELRLQ